MERPFAQREQVLGSQRLTVGIGDHTGRDGWGFGWSQVGEGMAGKDLPQPQDEMARPRPIGFRKHAGEFITAVARHEVGRANLALQDGTDFSQHPVTGSLAEPLVDIAQLLDVDQDEREMQRISPRPLELVAHPPVEGIE